MRRLRGRAERADRTNSADKAIRCDRRSNIERFFQPIHNHQ